MRRIFELPFLAIYRTMDPQRMKYHLPVMILNSLFWGIVLYAVIAVIGKKSREERVTADA